MSANGPTRTLVYEEEDRTESANFLVTPDDTGMNVPGPGSVDALLIVADSDSFGVRVESENATLVNENFSRLETYSDNLEHVDATTSSGDRIVTVRDFPFRESARAEVLVNGQDVTFTWVRAVYTIGGVGQQWNQPE